MKEECENSHDESLTVLIVHKNMVEEEEDDLK